MKDIMKIVKSLEKSGLLISSENKFKENKTIKRWILWYSLLDTLGASLKGSILADKRWEETRARERTRSSKGRGTPSLKWQETIREWNDQFPFIHELILKGKDTIKMDHD